MQCIFKMHSLGIKLRYVMCARMTDGISSWEFKLSCDCVVVEGDDDKLFKCLLTQLELWIYLLN